MQLVSSLEGLSAEEASGRLARRGRNEIVRRKATSPVRLLREKAGEPRRLRRG